MGIIVRNLSSKGLSNIRFKPLNIISNTFMTKDTEFTVNENLNVAESTTTNKFKFIRTNIDIAAIETETMFEFLVEGDRIDVNCFGIIDGLSALTSPISLGTTWGSVGSRLIDNNITSFSIFNVNYTVNTNIYSDSLGSYEYANISPAIGQGSVYGMLFKPDTGIIDFYVDDVYVTSSQQDYRPILSQAISNGTSLFLAPGGYGYTKITLL